MLITLRTWGLNVNKRLPSLPCSCFCLVTQRSSPTRSHDFIPIEQGGALRDETKTAAKETKLTCCDDD